MAWDNAWEDYFKGRSEWGKYPAECLIRFIAGSFYRQQRAATRLLEVGCGPGPNIWYMAREGFDVYGIDGSAAAIEMAKKRLADEKLSATLSVGDITKLPYESGYFDAVIDNECLYSNLSEDFRKILAEIRRVLKSGGLFYSRAFTDSMYVGSSSEAIGPMEYRNISDGPLAGAMPVRLIDRDGINELYGKFFKVVSVDKLEHTRDNGAINVSEWVIICKAKG